MTQSLWDFAVAIYGRLGVSDAAIALQDSYGADVPLILFCLWSPAENFSQLIPEVLAISRQWQAGVVAPLRASRRALKGMVADEVVASLHERVKTAELEAERLQLHALATLLGDRRRPSVTGRSRTGASQNLDAYFSAGNIQLDPLGKTLVLRILNTTFGS